MSWQQFLRFIGFVLQMTGVVGGGAILNDPRRMTFAPDFFSSILIQLVGGLLISWYLPGEHRNMRFVTGGLYSLSGLMTIFGGHGAILYILGSIMILSGVGFALYPTKKPEVNNA